MPIIDSHDCFHIPVGVNWVLQVMEKSLVNWEALKEQLRGILGPKVQEVAEGQRKYKHQYFIINIFM
jgi:hypothetical protein